MSKSKNIDEIFREGADGFNIEPSIEIWNKIEAANFGGNKKRVFPYWWFIAALFLGVFFYFIIPDFIKENKKANFIISTDSCMVEKNEDAIIHISENSDTININNEIIVLLENDVSKQKIKIKEPVKNTEQTELLDFGLNAAGTKTGFDVKNTKAENLERLNNRSIFGLNSETDNSLDQNEIPGLEKYVEKKSNLHFYSGIGGTVGMMYYPATKDQFTYSTDLSIGLKVKNVYLETGIGYQEMKEDGTVNIQFITKDSVGYYNKVLSFEVDPFNPANIIYNTLKTTVYDSINHFTVTYPTYQYNYLNFPLVVGYKIFDENKLIFTAQAGVIFSTMIGESFQPIDVSNSDYQIVETINTTPARVKNNLQMQLALRFGYRITPGLSVIAQPVFSKYLNSIYDTQAGYQNVKPYSMGVRFGIYYYF